MSTFDIVMPKMGESITEATITRWLKNVGEFVNLDDPIVEIATDKVDSEIPSPVEGTLEELLYKEGDTIPVGKVIAKIKTGNDSISEGLVVDNSENAPTKELNPEIKELNTNTNFENKDLTANSDKKILYSPLVRKMAKEENISMDELASINGTGASGRVTKDDVLNYLSKRKAPSSNQTAQKNTDVTENKMISSHSINAEDDIIEMDRVRRLIADHMVLSKKVSPHVNSFIEIDVSKIVRWREKVKNKILASEGEKLTFTHIFVEAAAKALKDYPRINSTLENYKIIQKKAVNIGIATALANGNLIVPVIKNANHLNLMGIVKSINDLASRARQNKLKPEEIQDGTFSITNLGSFGTDFGTPIINQPQLAILALGAIKKKPVVIESEQGDSIGIRSMMYASLAYDHRVIDGALGGMFLKRFAEYIENFDESLYL